MTEIVLYFGLVALYFLYRTLRWIPILKSNKKLLKETQSWKSTEGTIIKSEVEIATGLAQLTSIYGGAYIFFCNFEYQVDGKSITGVGPYLDLFYGYKYKTGALSKEYDVGKEVTVYYNPQNPYRSCLVRKFTGGAVGGLTFNAICLTLSTLVLYLDILWN